MRRWLGLCFPAGLLLVLVLVTDQLFAEEIWPRIPLDPEATGDAHTMVRGPGYYISIAKLVSFWLVFAVWVRTTDWCNRDCKEHRQNLVVWSPVLYFSFLVAAVAFFFIPSFVFGFLLVLTAYGVPLGVYIYLRNQKVSLSEQILTPDHFRRLFTGKESNSPTAQKKKQAKEKQQIEQAPLEFHPTEGASAEKFGNVIDQLRQHDGFSAAQQLLGDALEYQSEAVMLDYSQESVAVRYLVHGAWQNVDPLDRPTGDGLLLVLKSVAGMQPGERVKKQAGKLRLYFKANRRDATILSQGTETGERVTVRIPGQPLRADSLLEIGMREKTYSQLLEIMQRDEGLVLFSALPSGGLSTTYAAGIEEIDRLMRSAVIVEDEENREPEVESVEYVRYKKSANQTAGGMLPEIMHGHPDILIVPNLSDAETIDGLSEIAQNHLVVGTIRAKEATEALLRLLALKANPKKLIPILSAVVNVRLVRPLCKSCKVAYRPNEEMLKKLGIPASKVEAFYRPPKPEEREETCAKCHGIGYQGRTAIVELLVVDDSIREILRKQPKIEVLRKQARSAGNLNLQDEAMLLVVKGVTSLKEVQRVLAQ